MVLAGILIMYLELIQQEVSGRRAPENPAGEVKP